MALARLDRALDALAHLCAFAAFGLVVRSRGIDAWEHTVATDVVDGPSLTVLVPARNEEATIERCLRSLLTQTHRDLEVIAIDDRSDDRTPQILAALAEEFPALRIVSGEPLPDGWVGKPWALTQGARTARGEWLLFTDADSVHAPQACAASLVFARERGIDALTLGTYQELGSWGERAVLPTILGLVVLASGPMRKLNDPTDAKHALANGQYILVTRTAYDALGGHTALAGEIVEDVAFARRLKADGRFKLMIASGEDFVRVRMYHSLADVWNGFTKNMYAGAQGDLCNLAAGAFLTNALSSIPTVLLVDALIRRKPRRAAEAAVTIGVGIAVAAAGIRRTRLDPRLAWWAPVGYAVAGAIMVNSTLRVRSGRGVAWRGRTYSGH
jgi:chlorobactene glucosyltransferase